ncbi:MAG TPA: serpin family protein [Phycisphaerae bacterium]|nr:serpin family protein [Phycisphaerae bacterium]
MKHLVVGMAVLLTLGGCAWVTTEEKPPVASTEDVQAVAGGCNRFAFDLYAQLRGAEGNLFLSPYSISTALAMTYGGARGQTADQMAKVLCLPAGVEAVHAAYGALQNDFNVAGEGGEFDLFVANRLWGQKGYAFLKEFLTLVEKNYGAGIKQVDFAGATEEARKTINAWVEKQTQDKIQELLPPGVLDAQVRLVLTNAIYFKGRWAEEFHKRLTRDEDFFLTPEKKAAVPMMHQTADFGYFEGDGLQALELPYRGDRLAMVVLLPKAKDGLAALEASLSADKVAEWVGKLHRREVQVALPRFKTTAEFSLKDTLVAMGMAAAFGGDADFSGMTGAKDLFISAVVHKAFVDVNEEGTEAAAATAVVMGRAAMPEPAPVFCADHPFLFLIRDTKTGAILFFGRILDPTK